MEPRRIKVFGERSTGTRAAMAMLRALPHVTLSHPGRPTPSANKSKMREIVEQKLHGRLKNEFMDAILAQEQVGTGGVWAWKHAAPVFDQSFVNSPASVLFMVRNPYSWAVSLHRRPYHIRSQKPGLLEEFLDHPWLTMRRDNANAVLESPVCLWHLKVAAYHRFVDVATVPTAFLGLEDFVADSVVALGAVLSGFGISSTGLTALEHSTKDKAEGIEQVKSRSQDEDWKRQLSRQSVEIINSHIDWDLANGHGYIKLDPVDFPQVLPRDEPEINT